jgi:hypothetical protein
LVLEAVLRLAVRDFWDLEQKVVAEKLVYRKGDQRREYLEPGTRGQNMKIYFLNREVKEGTPETRSRRLEQKIKVKF